MEALGGAILAFFALIIGVMLMVVIGYVGVRFVIIKLITSCIRDIGTGIGAVFSAFKRKDD